MSDPRTFKLKSNVSASLFQKIEQAVTETEMVKVHGKVVQVLGTILKASVPGAKVGEVCRLVNRDDGMELMAEIVGFNQQHALLTPMGDMDGLSNETIVYPTGHRHQVMVSDDLLGRVVDGLGRPFDGRPIEGGVPRPVYADPPDPLSRKLIDRPLPLGIRALDGALTCGEGQRMGIFAAAGGGKSTLLGMLAKNAEVDVIVLALIGERGREVREFIEHDLGEEGLRRSVLVVATSDRPSLERLKSAYLATSIAEYFRDQGKRVLLMMDSVTRFARAQREIGLAAGEPPTRRGFPPSVFATLPKLLERSGQSDKGSITGLYTVLVEGDDMAEPVADETRSILDGHIILSRKLAAANHYPAIDVLRSASRVMNNVVSEEHRRVAGRLRELLSKHEEIELLIKIGEYKQGSDPVADEAVAKIKQLNGFLKQGLTERSSFEEALAQLKSLVG